MKLMTFNMRFNTAEDGENAWPYRKGYAAEIVRRSNVEAVGTQELNPDMIQDLTLLLPEYRWVGADRGDEEFCAVWYRPDLVELLESGDFMLSETPGVVGSMGWDAACPRICTWTLLRRREDDFVYALFNEHIDHVGEESRWRSMALILQRMAAMSVDRGGDLPMVLMGDMNAYPQERCIAMLSDESVNTAGLRNGFERLLDPVGKRLTFHDYKGGAQGEPIDYIFHSKHFEPVTVDIDRSLVNGKYPSDHYPVVMEMTYA